ncbi:DUF6213 family protein [Streptomyces sp. RerS4]|uniref:DUF6213 family protein n=1 Tax=Streptomyces sp. RerS4 TaxID=2942449 RepID=UPI00201C20A1|nr:DUF6213 family protein [Streptomyces sp. RerS4]UQX04246.1 DUF6213 family protein [Streptomyces sp. RerS4]
MIQVTIPLIPTSQGGPLIPADEVTTLLRQIAADWLDALETDPAEADPRTVRELSGVLQRLADGIDVECIAYTADPPRHGRRRH